MRPIDADALEKEGWSLHRTIWVDKNTQEYQTMPLANVPDIYVGECEDTISRQAAIDALGYCQTYLFDSRDDDKKISLEDAKYVIEQLPSAQPEQRWIPCSERLPEEKDAKILKKLGINMRSDYVLATVEVKGERMTILSHTFDGVWQWDKKYAFPDYNVIAWMPLPEPYKEENDEQIRGFGL